MKEMARRDANTYGVDYYDLLDQLVRETMRAWAESGEPLVEQLSGCRIPDCQCDGRIEDMQWGSVDMTETDDSEYEDPDDRANRLYEESCNYDLSAGMTPKTDTPPLRRNNNRQELQESTSYSELVSQTDEESLNSEPTVQPGTVADEDIPTHGGEGDIYGPNELTGWTGCDADSTSVELSEIIDRRSQSR